MIGGGVRHSNGPARQAVPAVLVGDDTAHCVDPELVNAGNVLLVNASIPPGTRQQLLEHADLVAVLNGSDLGWPMAQDVAYAEAAGKPIRWHRPPSWTCSACTSAAVTLHPNHGFVRCAACGWVGTCATPWRWRWRWADLLREPTPMSELPPVRLAAKDVRVAATLVHDPLWLRFANRRARVELGGGLGGLLGEAARRHVSLVLSGPEAAALVRLLTMVAADHSTVTSNRRATAQTLQVRDRLLLAYLDRDRLGAAVRAAWVGWPSRQPHPKPSWLAPWGSLAEPDREADRLIGNAVADLVMASMTVEPGTPVGRQ
jgi:hypothetical protein